MIKYDASLVINDDGEFPVLEVLLKDTSVPNTAVTVKVDNYPVLLGSLKGVVERLKSIFPTAGTK